jgi:protein involved in polysaccharide export with SLBB domain
MKKFCLLAALVILFGGCSHPRPKYAGFRHTGARAVTLNSVNLTNRISPDWLKPDGGFFTLGPGDRLEIEILGEPASRTTTFVAPDGKIYFNVLSGIDVWGLTLAQAKARLEDEMANFVREKPQISLLLRGVVSKRVWILGRVQVPGVYALAAPTTLLDAISQAGGTMALTSYQDQEAAGIGQDMADLRRSFVIRQGKLLPINFSRLLNEGDLSQNIYLQPDDFVYFPASTAREIYVLGAVAQPRPVLYSENMTVAAAVASAYGTIKGAYLRHVAVVRGSLDHPEIAIVDYKAVIRGEARDIPLQPHDIVYVPFSPYRYLVKYAEVIINTFVSASAINAGTSVFTKQPTAGAGIFIPVGSGIQVIPPVSPPPIH